MGKGCDAAVEACALLQHPYALQAERCIALLPFTRGSEEGGEEDGEKKEGNKVERAFHIRQRLLAVGVAIRRIIDAKVTKDLPLQAFTQRQKCGETIVATSSLYK